MPKFEGYEPRHIASVEVVFCESGCLIIDGIKVPFPDCISHGKPFTRDPMCAILEVPPLKS